MNQQMDSPDKKCQAYVAEPAVRQPCKKTGVLVVDDDHLVRIMVQLGLERNGFDVWLARNGREAIELYRAHREDIAVVLLDFSMPGWEGPQTLEALREVNPEVQACLMSGNSDAWELDASVHWGDACVIMKPFLPADLVNTLRLLGHDASAKQLPVGRSGHGDSRETPTHGSKNAHDSTGKPGELQGTL